MKNQLSIVFLIFLVLSKLTANGYVPIENGTGERSALVYMSDFGLKDGAVSAMHGVAYGVDSNLSIFNLTHEIPAFNIWEGAYRLNQTINFWPAETVFVCVVDPGVGTNRKSVVAKTSDGKYIVTPNNGTLTLVADAIGIIELREIDEDLNRLEGSYDSYTFHGRDVYSYTGARLAAGKISYEEVGPALKLNDVLKLDYQMASINDNIMSGTIPILDIQYGNVWTNIPQSLFEEFGLVKGESYDVKIFNGEELIYSGLVPYVNSFGDVPLSQPLLYSNSLLNLSIALNFDDFAGNFGVGSGPEWSFILTKE